MDIYFPEDAETEGDIINYSNRLRDLHVVRSVIGHTGFPNQFHRTIHLKATDHRNKVFKILRICNILILADYLKTIDQVFSQAMVLII